MKIEEVREMGITQGSPIEIIIDEDGDGLSKHKNVISCVGYVQGIDKYGDYHAIYLSTSSYKTDQWNGPVVDIRNIKKINLLERKPTE